MLPWSTFTTRYPRLKVLLGSCATAPTRSLSLAFSLSPAFCYWQIFCPISNCSARRLLSPTWSRVTAVCHEIHARRRWARRARALRKGQTPCLGVFFLGTACRVFHNSTVRCTRRPSDQFQNRRQILLYWITEGLPVIRQVPTDWPHHFTESRTHNARIKQSARQTQCILGSP